MVEGVQISRSLRHLQLHILGIFLALPCEEVQKFLRLFKATMKHMACLSDLLSLLRLVSRLKQLNQLLLLDVNLPQHLAQFVICLLFCTCIKG